MSSEIRDQRSETVVWIFYLLFVQLDFPVEQRCLEDQLIHQLLFSSQLIDSDLKVCFADLERMFWKGFLIRPRFLFLKIQVNSLIKVKLQKNRFGIILRSSFKYKDTSVAAFREQVLSYRHFPKGDFPSDNFHNGNFPNVKFPKLYLPKVRIGLLRRHRRGRALRLGQTWEVAALEIALRSCHFWNWSISIWKVSACTI